MIIKPHQIFIIDKHWRENDKMNHILSDKFNRVFRENTRTFLRSSYEGLAPYKFIRADEHTFRCIKTINSNQTKVVSRVKIHTKYKDHPITFEIMFINMSRLNNHNIDSYRDVLKMKREYEIKTAK